MLKTMITMQNTFQLKMEQNIQTMTPEEKTAYIKEHSIHLTQEIHEMLYELPYFKPWKDYTGMTELDRSQQLEKAREEFIDMWHFVLNIAIALELDSDDIYNRYILKNKENYKRQDDHYTHDKSYRKEDTK